MSKRKAVAETLEKVVPRVWRGHVLDDRIALEIEALAADLGLGASSGADGEQP